MEGGEQEFDDPLSPTSRPESFIYRPSFDLDHSEDASTPIASAFDKAQTTQPDPGLITLICDACSLGDLVTLESLIESAHFPKFTLANTPHPKSSLYPLSIAASRGYVHICQYLLESCGSLILPDASGETPIHLAAYKGHGQVLRLLVDASDSPVENAQLKDADGWTGLHNACSRGWLDIVRFFVQEVGVDINVASNLGHTALMNAASKGNLPIINYLLTRGTVDVFQRNKHGEAAYDVATTCEPFICEILAAAERVAWDQKQMELYEDLRDRQSYNPLAVHVAAIITLHENQRLDVRFGHKSNFTSSAITKTDNRAPYTLPPSYHGLNGSAFHLPVFRSEVGLPAVENPVQISLPPMAISSLAQQRLAAQKSKRPTRSRKTSAASTASVAVSSQTIDWYANDSFSPMLVPTNAERSHFWLSDWFIDLTAPTVDPNEGWEYSTSFDAPSEQWAADPPAELQRLMSQPASHLNLSGSQNWVRRRRWVRAMRRRLDRPPLPFADVDIGAFQQTTSVSHDSSGPDVSLDYLARARWRAGVHHTLGSFPASADGASVRSGRTSSSRRQPATNVEARRIIARLETAITELRIGLLSDDDSDRSQQASALMETYVSRLDDIKRNIDVQSPDNEEAFVYDSQHSLSDTGRDYFNSTTTDVSANRQPDLTPHLAQASDFRVPTRDSPLKARVAPVQMPTVISTIPTWERDGDVSACRRCQAAFSLFKRKHHCRACGKIACAECCSTFDRLEASDTVLDPMASELLTPGKHLQRTCKACHDEIAARALSPSQQDGLSLHSDLLRTILTPLSQPGSPLAGSEISSQTSTLSECPVCGFTLSSLGNQADQEEHIRSCLDQGQSNVTNAQRYLVFKLGSSPLTETECQICFEPFEMGTSIARLPCFCFYHRNCLAAWLARGGACPLHAR